MNSNYDTNINEDIISSKRSFLDVNIKEIWKYRDLIVLFVKRDFVAQFKQTMLGPVWFFIQPIFTTIIFTFVFGKVGNFSPSGKPAFLYYLSGIVLWQFFADCLKKTSSTFISNQNIFGKVYFPRLAVPISVIISNLMKLSVQLLLFLFFYCFYVIKGFEISVHKEIVFLPLLIFMAAGLGLGFGLIISSLTTKYRDLTFLVDFGVQLLMYITPGIVMSLGYFMKNLPKYSIYIKLNPMGSVIEAFKYVTLGAGLLDWKYLAYSFILMIVIIFIGLLLFNKTEQNFMDTV